MMQRHQDGRRAYISRGYFLVPHRWNRRVLLVCTLSVSQSVRHTRFPDFSSLCFHRSGWKLVASFYMKSYRSSSTFVTIDLLFHEILPFVQNSFSGLSSAIAFTYLNESWQQAFIYEELHIKFNFCHDWSTFSWVIALCSNSFSELFFRYAFTNLNGSSWQASTWRVTDQVRLPSQLTYFFMSYCPSKFVFQTFLGY